jgi:hypothetical protein
MPDNNNLKLMELISIHEWLINYRFDPQLEELLESHQAVVSNLTDSRVGSKFNWHSAKNTQHILLVFIYRL